DYLTAVDDAHAAAEIAPAPAERISLRQAGFGQDAEEGEVGRAGERAGVECCGIAGGPEKKLVRLSAAGSAAAALDAVEGLESLGVEREQWQTKQVRFG